MQVYHFRPFCAGYFVSLYRRHLASFHANIYASHKTGERKEKRGGRREGRERGGRKEKRREGRKELKWNWGCARKKMRG